MKLLTDSKNWDSERSIVHLTDAEQYKGPQADVYNNFKANVCYVQRQVQNRGGNQKYKP